MNDEAAKAAPDTGDDLGQEAGRFAAKLQKDVRIWSANEDQASDRHEDAAQALAAKQIKAAADSARRRATAKAKAAAAEKPAARKPGPFSMSYDGQTVADHLKARRALGAR